MNYRQFDSRLLMTTTALTVLAITPGIARANPLDGQVVAGSANIVTGDKTVDVIQQSNRAVIDWRSFNIGIDEATRFYLPDANSIVVNRINDANPSAILGKLQSNGNVVLINPNGILFGQNAVVDVNGLLATTADIDNDQFMAGSNHFDKASQNENASIINEGQITAKEAGLVGLVAPNVINSGVITAKLGRVELASGDTVTVDFRGNGLTEIAVSDKMKSQLIRNTGKIDASGGTIAITAAAGKSIVNSLIDIKGELKAPAVAQHNGTISIFAAGSHAVKNNITASKTKNVTSHVTIEAKLDASGKNNGEQGGDILITGDDVSVKSGSVIDASGDIGGGSILIGGDQHGEGTTATALNTDIESGVSILNNALTSGNGGKTIIWSDELTKFAGSIEGKGGIQIGDGGFTEVSGKHYLDFTGKVNLLANNGTTGTLLLDPEDVTIQTSGTPAVTCTSGVCTPVSDSSILTVADLQAALASSNVRVNTGATGAQAGNITVANNVTWSSGNMLILDAYKNITINSGVTLSNTYAGSFSTATNAIPVLLALRADATGINNGGSVTNNGTINFSGSTGAVSIFYDRATYGGSYTPGTLTANGSWVAPANKTVSTQFTAYQLINTATDMASIGSALSGNYELGKNIVGGGASFNSDTALGGTFTGILDGQYCVLAGGVQCSFTGFTMNFASAATSTGMFGASSGIIRNLNVGIDITQSTITTGGFSYNGVITASNSGTIANVISTGANNITQTGAVAKNYYFGGLVGVNTGTITGVTVSGAVSFTNTSSAIQNLLIGGLAGFNDVNGTITNSTVSSPITITMKTNATVLNVFTVGGLVGQNYSTAPISISDSSASGNILGQYFDASYNTGVAAFYAGGLIGRNGTNTAVALSNVFASGNVTDYLQGSAATQYLAGLIAYNNTSTTNLDNVHASGNISYSGGANIVSAGGLIGYASVGAGNYNNVYATGNIDLTATGAISTNFYAGGLMGVSASSTTGAVINNGYSQTGAITITNMVSGGVGLTAYVGGLIGNVGGTNAAITGTSYSSENVTYTYKGTSTVNQTLNIGGLIGLNQSAATNAISGAYASGNILAKYFDATYNTGIVSVSAGGLVGSGGNNTTGIISSYASGSVTDNVQGASSHYLGGLLGYNLAGTTGAITSSYATGNVTYSGSGNTIYAGGLIGSNSSATVTSSYATGNVDITYSGVTSATIYIGGLIGLHTGPAASSVISNSYAQTGTVTLTNAITSGANIVTAYVGGLLGSMAGTNTSISGTSTSSENVTYIYKGASTGAHVLTIGGLIGYNSSLATNSISGITISNNVLAQYFDNTYNAGNVTVYGGGLVGQNGNNSATGISNSSASGTVTDYLNLSSHVLGGLVGYNYSSTGSVTNSFATGKVTYSGTGAYIYAGGLFGSSNATNITTSYATGSVDITYSGATAATIYAGGLIGTHTGPTTGSTISNSYAQTGAVTLVNAINGGSAAISAYMGGLIGNMTGINTVISGTSFSSENVTYTHKGTSTGIQSIYLGGLIGYSTSQATNSVNGATASGNILAQYFDASYNARPVNVVAGGLIGQNAFNNATGIIVSYASGNVTDYLQGTSTGHNLGGLIGYNQTTVGTIDTSHASGNVTYSGSAASNIGGLVGYLGGTTASVTSSYATGNVDVTYNGTVGVLYSIGGLVGYNQATSTISNSYTLTGAVTMTNAIASGSAGNTAYMGGLVGTFLGVGSSISGTSYSSENVTFTYKGAGTGTQYAVTGGLIGYNGTTVSPTSISGANASGNILVQYFDASYNAGLISVTAGGLVGQNGNTTQTGITNSFATGNVTIYGQGAGTTHYIGGLIGNNLNTTGILNNVYATGKVTYSGTTPNIYIGGLIGTSTFSTGSITTAYATGDLDITYSGATGASTYYLGGLVGSSTGGGNMSNVYTKTGAITFTSAIAHTTAVSQAVIGGLFGSMTGASAAITGTSYSSENLTYTFKGSSTGLHSVTIGGLIGNNTAASANVINGATASGNILLQYFDASYNTKQVSVNAGGLVGQNGNNTATGFSGASASGNITDYLQGASALHYLGGLIGTGSITTNNIDNAHATGNIIYNGTAANVSIGGLIGNGTFSSAASLTNSYATGNIDVNYTGSTAASIYLGGLIGVYTGSNSSVINNSYSQTGAITITNAMGSGSTVATILAGGLVGNMGTANAAITGSSYSSENITYTQKTASTGIQVLVAGGLVGYNVAGTTNSINGATASGNILAQYFDASYNTGLATVYAGGLVGQNGANAPTGFSGSSASGNVTDYLQGASTTHYLGGLVGYNYTTSGVISNSYASGNVTYSGYAQYIYVGGLIGHNNVSTGNIATTYATGNVDVTYNGAIASTINIGGLVGLGISTTGTGISNGYSKTGSITFTNAINGGSAVVSANIGGLVGSIAGSGVSISGTSYSSENLTYTYKGSSTGLQALNIGGLVGINTATSANTINAATASGNILLQYFSAAYNTGSIGISAGGLVGLNGNNTASALSGSSASGNITDYLQGPSASHYLGGLIGTNYNTTTAVDNAHASGNITYSGAAGGVVAGGLIGLNQQSTGNITTTYATGNIDLTYTGSTGANYSAGGLVGNNSALSTGGSISNSYAQTGSIKITNASSSNSSMNSFMGGLVGAMSGTGASITGTSTSSGSVTYISKATGSAQYNVNIGGLIGQNTSTAANSINGVTTSSNVLIQYYDASYNTALVAVNAGGLVGQNGTAAVNFSGASASGNVTDYTQGALMKHYLGGLIGYNLSTTGAIDNSHASGNVTYLGNATQITIGGLIGYQGASTGNITNSYVTGSIDLTYNGTSSISVYAGGLVGYSSPTTGGSISNSYAQTGTITVTNAMPSGSGAMTANIGGLVAYMTGSNAAITGTSYSSQNLYYYYKGGTTGGQNVYIGGLIGQNGSTATISINGATSSSNVFIQYFDASYNTGLINTFAGGLVGQNGISTATGLSGASATGNVIDYTQGNTSSHYLGGLIGYNANTTATIDNSHASGNITYNGNTSKVYAGGLIGYNAQTTGNITASYATGSQDITYTGTGGSLIYLGGLVGYNAPTSTGGNITNSYATTGSISFVNASGVSGNIVTSGIGGLVGYMSGTGAVISGTSYATQNISYVYKGASSSVQINYMGGLVGYNLSTAAVSISNAYAFGNVTATYDAAATGNKYVSSYMGGLIGQMGNTTAVAITTSFSTGNVRSEMQGTGTTQYLGGLIGNNASNATTAIQDTYALGSVIYSGNLAGAKIGGLVGNSSSVIKYSYAAGFLQAAAGTIGGVAGGGSYTCTNCYWDGQTTGTAISVGGTSQTTAQLQAALPTGFSSGVWGILPGISYPYLKGIYTATPTVVTGKAYSDHGTTLATGTAISGLVNGAIMTGGSGISGANGYYYYMLFNGTVSAGGSQVMNYYTGATKGNVFQSGATGNVTNFDMYGNYVHIYTGDVTLATTTANLAMAQGANSGSNFLYTLSSGNLSITSNKNLDIDYSSTSAIDKTITLAGTGILDINTTNTLTQSQAIIAPSAVFTGAGSTYTLTNTNNNFGTIAANGGSAFSLNNGTNNVTVGTVSGVAGITTTGATSIVNAGTITLNNVITAGGAGTSITLAGTKFTNNAGASALNVGGGGGRFLVWSADPGQDNRGSVVYNFKQYNATYGVTTVAGTGNGFLYTLAPTLTVSITSPVTKAYDGATSATLSSGNYTTSAAIDGDSVVVSLPTSGSYDTKAVGTGKNVSVSGISVTSSSNGAATVYGYQVNSTANANVGVITTAALTITANSTSKTYGNTITFAGTEYSVGAGLISGDTITGVTLSSAGAAMTANASVTPYAIAASNATGTGLSNYTITYVDGGLTVNKANLTVTANSSTKTYGDVVTYNGTQYSQTGLVNSDAISGLTITSTGAAATANASVTPYAVIASNASGTGLSNYNVSYVDGGLTVNKAGLVITANTGTKTYGNTVNYTGSEYTQTGLVNSDAISGLTITSSGAAATANASVIPYAVTASNASGTGLSNYNISYVDGGLTVNKAGLVITANSSTKTYGNTVTYTGAEYSQTGLVNSDNISGLTITSGGAAATANASVTPYAVVASNALGTGLSNYNVSYVDGGLTVNKAGLTITANSSTKTYGNTVTYTGSEYTQTGLVNSDAISSLTINSAGAAATANASVTPYAVTASSAGGTGLSNYTISYVDGSLTVNKAGLTITSNSTTKTYGATTVFSGTEFTQSGLLNSDNISGITLNSAGAAATANASVIPYAITGSNASGSGLSNYNISYVDGGLTVNKAGLTITSNNTTKTYGNTTTFASTEFSQTGLVNSDTISSVTLTSSGAAATANASVIPYAIVASNAAGSGLANYTVSYVDGGLTVNKAGLVITANSTTKTYGDVVTYNGTQYSQTGLVNSDAISGLTITSTGAAATANASATPYNVIASNVSGTGLSNYNISYVNGGLTVGKANLTITANNATKTYGNTFNFAGTEFTKTGLVNSDTVSSVSFASSGSVATANASTTPYAITALNAVGSGLSNYNVSYVDGGLTVGKANLVITANSTTKTYGNLVTYTGSEYTKTGLVNSDTITGLDITSAGAVITANASTTPYAVIASNATGAGLSNYNISYADGGLTVNKANLTITASNGTKTYGDVANFAGTECTQSGLLNSDTITGVTLISSGAAATANSSVIPYAINASNATGNGVTNYNISYVDGGLTVNKAALVITANNNTKLYGTTLNFIGTEFTTNGLRNSDAVSSVTLASPGSNSGAPVASYAITVNNAVGSGFSNYNISYVSGTLVVTAVIAPPATTSPTIPSNEFIPQTVQITSQLPVTLTTTSSVSFAEITAKAREGNVAAKHLKDLIVIDPDLQKEIDYIPFSN